jgi:hypothetical protein
MLDKDLDHMLARMGAGAEHPALAGMEDRVLAAIAAQPVASLAKGATFAAMTFALLLGVASHVLTVDQAVASPMDPISAAPALAPSNLLLGSQ